VTWRGFRTEPAPGLSVHCAHWIFEREIAVLATDTFDSEVNPCETECDAPLRRISVHNGGLLVGAMFDLDELSDACAADRNYAFLFVAPPLSVAGADCTRVNPVVIK
jgi:kynurenine formamidase